MSYQLNFYSVLADYQMSFISGAWLILRINPLSGKMITIQGAICVGACKLPRIHKQDFREECKT